jgi:hypothetical protein
MLTAVPSVTCDALGDTEEPTLDTLYPFHPDLMGQLMEHAFLFNIKWLGATQFVVWFTEEAADAFLCGSPLPVQYSFHMERHLSEPLRSRTRCELARHILEGMLGAGIDANWDGNPESPIYANNVDKLNELDEQ